MDYTSKRSRLRIVSNFGDDDCGAGKIHARARTFGETRREGSASFRRSFRVALCLLEISRASVCISPAPQSPSPKLETTRRLTRSGNTPKLIALC